MFYLLEICYSLYGKIDLYFLIPAVIAQTFNPTAELVIPIGIAINKVNEKIEMQPVTVEAKISKCYT